jgi:hypothetical protein
MLADAVENCESDQRRDVDPHQFTIVFEDWNPRSWYSERELLPLQRLEPLRLKRRYLAGNDWSSWIYAAHHVDHSRLEHLESGEQMNMIEVPFC